MKLLINCISCNLVTNANNNKTQHQTEAAKNSLHVDGAAAGALQELDVVHRELGEMAREKAALALELSSHKTELVTLRSEIARLKVSFVLFRGGS